MKRNKFVCLLAAALLLTSCGKTDNGEKTKAKTSLDTSASADDTSTVDESSSAEIAVTPTTSSTADSSSQEQAATHVEETPGAREYDGAAANDDFADALFIGDSRTVGLMLNGDKPLADYFATPGLNVMTAQTTPVVPKSDYEGLLTEQAFTVALTDYQEWGDDYTWDDGTWDGGETEWSDPEGASTDEYTAESEPEPEPQDDDLMTIPEAIALKQYGRVFINFGVNELGWPAPDVFVERYKLLVLQVRAAQPNAQIYIESMLPVSYLALDIDPCYTTANVDNFNENYIRRVAEETNCTYLDVNQFFRDSRGDLFFEASTDGIHLTRDYCLEWMDILAYYTNGGPAITIPERRDDTSTADDTFSAASDSISEDQGDGGYYDGGYDDYGYGDSYDYGYGDDYGYYDDDTYDYGYYDDYTY